MKNFFNKNRRLFAGVIIGSLTIFFISSLIVDKRLENLEGNIEANIKVATKSLDNLAGEIARGEANTIATMTVKECSQIEQAQFDSRLSKLDTGQSIAELRELDTLFSRCAPSAIIKRAAMVVQLEAQYKVLNLLVEQRKIVGTYDNYDNQLVSWEALVQAERQITKLSFDSLNLQYEIVRQLISGLKVDSKEADELKNQGQIIRLELSKLVSEASLLHKGLK